MDECRRGPVRGSQHSGKKRSVALDDSHFGKELTQSIDWQTTFLQQWRD